MSYLSQLKNHQITAKQFLAKSVTYLATKTGLTVSDEAVDHAVQATDDLTDKLELVLGAFIRAHLPALPAAIATSAATAALNVVDAAVAGAGNVIKDNN